MKSSTPLPERGSYPSVENSPKANTRNVMRIFVCWILMNKMQTYSAKLKARSKLTFRSFSSILSRGNSSGKKECSNAQNASPSAQLELKSVISTPWNGKQGKSCCAITQTFCSIHEYEARVQRSCNHGLSFVIRCCFLLSSFVPLLYDWSLIYRSVVLCAKDLAPL